MNLKKIIINLIKIFIIIFAISLALSAIIGGIFAGIWTLIPAEIVGWGATKLSYLGYVAHCSFAPFSTMILFGITAVGAVLQVYITKYIIKVFRTWSYSEV